MLVLVGAAVGQHIAPNGSGELHLEVWQIINLVGAPILALLFAQPVVDDLSAWVRATRAAKEKVGRSR